MAFRIGKKWFWTLLIGLEKYKTRTKLKTPKSQIKSLAIMSQIQLKIKAVHVVKVTQCFCWELCKGIVELTKFTRNQGDIDVCT